MSAEIGRIIADKLDGGMSVCEVCDTYGYSYGTVRRMYEDVRGVAWFDGAAPRRGGRKKFTADVADYAAAMWEHGATAQEIADVAGVTLHTAYMYMMRHRDMFPYRHDMSRRARHGEAIGCS